MVNAVCQHGDCRASGVDCALVDFGVNADCATADNGYSVAGELFRELAGADPTIACCRPSAYNADTGAIDWLGVSREGNHRWSGAGVR